MTDLVINSLSILSKKDWEKLILFASSPYLNKKSLLVPLVKHLATIQTTFCKEDLSLDQLPESVFPNQVKDPKKLSYLRSDLQKLIREFLAYEEIKKDKNRLEYYSYLALLRKGKQRKPLKGLERLYEKNRLESANSPAQMLLQFQLTESLLDYTSESSVKKELYLKKSIENVLNYFQFYILRFGFQAINRQTIHSKGVIEIPFKEELFALVKTSNNVPLLTQIYFSLCEAAQKNNEEVDMAALVNLLLDKPAAIDKEELKQIYFATINIALRNIRYAPQKYTELALRFYTNGISKRILFDSGHLTDWTLNNTVRLALRLKRYDWVQQFILEQYKFIRKDIQSQALNLNLAQLHFEKGNFDAALLHLQEVRTNSIRYNIIAKLTLIKTLYENHATDACISALAAFTVYLSRTKTIATGLKKSCQHFCQLLHHTLMQTSEKKRLKAKERILTQQPLAEREWLKNVFEREHPKL